MNKKNDDYLAWQLYCENALMDQCPCAYPDCPSTGRYTSAGSYTRSLICYSDEKIENHTICVKRLECSSCGHTHALLPSVVIPYSPFSFHFVISLLYDYITHKHGTVMSLCLHYDISVSTLYRIRRRFLDDKKLMLGIMEDAITSANAFLCGFLSCRVQEADQRLMAYFQAVGTSFLQGRCTLRLKRNPINPVPDPATSLGNGRSDAGVLSSFQEVIYHG